MKILVTGGAGFIGSNLIKYILRNRPNWTIVNFDALTYAGNLNNLEHVSRNPNYRWEKGDICDSSRVDDLMPGVDAVIHLAAESHVDRSIENSGVFLRTNIVGTGVLLEAAKRNRVQKFIHVSTDEVYGSIDSGFFAETSPLRPNSPYAASKAGSDLLALSYFATFGLDVTVTRCSNNFGPNQFPEKFLPLIITNAISGQPLPIYGDGLYKRDWLYVEDHCAALCMVLEKGKAGEIYNIGGEKDRTNLEMAKLILEKLNRPESLIRFVKDRPGHDRRYAIDSSRIETELGWGVSHRFEDALNNTIRWYEQNQKWWNEIKSGEYLKYYDANYSHRFSGTT